MITLTGTPEQTEALLADLRHASEMMPKVYKSHESPGDRGQAVRSATYEGFLERVRPVLLACNFIPMFTVDRVEDLPPIDRGMNLFTFRVRVFAILTLVHTKGGTLSARGCGEAQADNGEFLLASATTHARRLTMVGALALVTTEDQEQAIPLPRPDIPPDDRIARDPVADPAPTVGEPVLSEDELKQLAITRVRELFRKRGRISDQNDFCKSVCGKAYLGHMALPDLLKVEEALKALAPTEGNPAAA